MRVFKFGGASVKDTESIKNVKTVLEQTGYDELVVVVSAMGKMTNALEKVVHHYLYNSKEVQNVMDEVVQFHHTILVDLFPEKAHPIYEKVASLFKEMKRFLESNKSPNYSYVYDQIVCYGELVSTKIISAYLNSENITNTWLDSRECIKTDSSYRDANVDWELTRSRIKTIVKKKGLTITQGFLGANYNNFTTTLGREGSDYTAAIFAYCLDAKNVTIWKDVPGILNADPRVFKETILLQQISYKEAIEMAFYGASVIHPKTLQPLQRKEIPLYVKSFLNPMDPGTSVAKGKDLDPAVSCYVVKKEQLLISLSSLDFSFIMEDHIGDVFKLLHEHQMKVNLIQNSAISFSVCVDNRFNKLEELLSALKPKFKVNFNENVTLYTIRHFKEAEVVLLENNFQVLVKQQSRETVQFVVK
ncbi:MAG: aspartate kinase [Flavobacteriaceae bacterium CG_4_8_14_3_um_filter_34_10]|nr:aspartate kinase [Flavobacteriia bacterium]OIP49613.1 MAG: aspartate kinase [Flavobacteriaceae bacterium CG2_30_34_30]PIQ18355.1 MAG: aspartate kinase [Flavobacteriaceae bacterium CG18_big_fil_WC_8_21_14_2_50_34_36]PIV49744.1 MAG: aspartate kinase [Flavobacteriaceae bacterium CG02_land_8_20_14_3_00_34_13]PIX08727.1 MAG: aspartate kinase [Flavobacteriaceae bacterium CG_4_8_14_3_um_filter_34_10]PIZ08750.1 MAG: aspartate kinase [Flavobacteriaceae bacterium CG_4_10_14_0_8_um_filter_34_31]PJC07